MANDRSFRYGRLDADPRPRPNSRSDIQAVPSGSAVKQDNGARVFAVIAIFLFACYFVGALTVHAEEDSARSASAAQQPSRHVHVWYPPSR
jgi:hypothetical protein